MTRRHMFFYSAKPFSHLAALVFLPLLIYPLWVLYFVFVDLFNPWQDAPGRRVWQTVPVDRRMAGQVRWLFGVVGGATLAIAYRTIILWFFVQESAHAITESIAYAGFYLLAASLAVATSSILHHLQDASTRPALMAWGWALGLILSLLAMEQLVRPTAVSMLFVWIGAIVAARGAYVLSADPRWFEWLGRQANQSVRRRTSEKTADPPAKPALDARVLGRLLDRKSVGTSDGSAMWWESLRPFQWHALLFLLFILSLPVLVVFELLTPALCAKMIETAPPQKLV